MRFLDEQKRVFGFIYWVDMLLLVAALLVIGKAVWSFWPTRPAEQKIPVYITIEATNIHPDVAKNIRPGIWMKDARSGVGFGTIIRESVVPHYIVAWDSQKEFKRRAYPERVDIRLTLRRTARFKENEGCFIGVVPIRAGRKGVFYTMLAEFKGEVIQVAKYRPDSSE